MHILALDLSTKSTGWCVFQDTKLIDFGCITASSTDVIKRIYKMRTELKLILQKYTISKVIVEEVRPTETQYGVGNQHTQKILMWLQAAIAFMLHDDFNSIDIEYTYPSEWRKACGIRTGRGVKRDSLKVADIKFVKDTYNVDVNDDEADAICIGHAFVNKLDTMISWE